MRVLFFLLLGLRLAMGRDDELKVEVLYKPSTCSQVSREGDYLSYHYVGRLLDGTEFDCSFNYGKPYRFTLGRRMVILGMDRGLVGVCVGERRKITIPPDMAYGESGAGEKIPPNSTLVFYVDMLTIERNGHALSPSETFDDLYMAAVNAYFGEHYEESTVLFESALKAKKAEDAFLRDCYRRTCTVADMSHFSSGGGGEFRDAFLEEISLLVERIDCVKKCRQSLFGRHKRFDAVVAADWERRIVYNYLQFAYHKMNRMDEAREASQAYFEFNKREDLATRNVKYYHGLMPKGEVIYKPREWHMEHKQLYTQARRDYGKQKWSEAIDKLEEALEKFYVAFDDCRLGCLENFTYFFDQDLDNEIGDDVLGATTRYVGGYVTCQLNCFLTLTEYEEESGAREKRFIGSHYNYLQFAYYKLDDVKNATQCAATYLHLHPDDDTAKSNVIFYEKQPGANLTPRDDAFQFESELAKLRLVFQKIRLPHEFLISTPPDSSQRKKGDLGSSEEKADAVIKQAGDSIDEPTREDSKGDELVKDAGNETDSIAF